MSVRELFPDYLKPNNSQGCARPGEFFWVPTAEIDFQVIETQRATSTAHTEARFQLANYHESRHYREKEHLPVKLIHLDERSEALLYRSKKRPCLVLGSAKVGDHGSLVSVNDQHQTKQLSKTAYVVAPAYSANCAADPRGPFPPEMLLRIEKLQYAHLAWMPPLDGQGPGSVLRLDRIFAVSSELLTVTARCGHKASQDAFEIIQAQVAEVLGVPRHAKLEDIFRDTKQLVSMA